MNKKKVKLQITSWLNGSVLFEYECIDNTIAKTVTEAVAGSANLRYADLGSANLGSANLGSANLRSANLGSANLGSANLRYANLRYENLGSANLRYANLRYANLRYAYLGSANLGSANLRSANLRYADLGSANLGSANLRYADLGSANLRSADLGSANLGSANLGYADLGSANLRYADLGSANLRYAKNAKLAIAMTRILPEGDIIGWKKCRDNIIVKLLIPAKAKRSHAFGRKCRAEYAEVLQVYKAKEAISIYDASVVYRKGETVKPSIWDDDFTNECSGGIHFYITKEESINHE
jgi:uncharacterized protein YjbI with pentapeptide repeats